MVASEEYVFQEIYGQNALMKLKLMPIFIPISMFKEADRSVYS